MALPLTPLECELLEAVVEQRDNAPAVLGDYWLENGNEARGAFLHLHLGANRERIDLADEEARLAPIAHGWRTPLVAAGYRERDLVLADGFLQTPLSLPAHHLLDGDPDLVRLSPRYYREVGEPRYGGEHVVHEAEAVTPRTRTRVALKTTLFDQDERVLARETEHLRRMARLAHPNLPRLLGHATRVPLPGRDNDRTIVLAWAGRDLAAILRSARDANHQLGVAFALSIGVQLLDALEALTHLGITHGELRPDHVLVAADGTVTLIDYGYALSDLPRADALTSPTGQPRHSLRYRYLAPEQARGHPTTDRVDVFQAAGVISELVANEHPLPLGDNDFETLQNVVFTTQMASPLLPITIRAPLQAALAPDPQHRPSASQLRQALRAGVSATGIAIGPHVIAQLLVERGVPA